MSEQAFRIAALLPPSTIFPGLSESFYQGLQMGFQQFIPGRVELFSDPISSGRTDAENTIRYLHSGKKADLFTGLFQPGLASILCDLLPKDRPWLVACDAGANAPRLSELQPSLTLSTLGLWQANFALGRWSAENLGKKAVMTFSFYEGGYDLGYAFQTGFESAGGEVQHIYLTHTQPGQDNLEPVIQSLQQYSPDVFYAAYSGPDAVHFLQTVASTGSANKIPIAAPPFLVDGPWFNESGADTPEIYSALSWDAGLAFTENITFQEEYQRVYGALATPFAALGYDTAGLIAQGLRAANFDIRQAANFAAGMAVGIRGTRGFIRMDPASRASEQPLYLRKVQVRGGKFEKSLLGELPLVTDLDDAVQPLRAGLRSGWFNPYLSV